MNSKLLKKKWTLIFSAVFAILIVSCVFLNAFLVKPAVAKSGNNVDSSATDEVTEDEPEIERKKTDDGFIYYILTDDNKNVYVTINSYDGDEKNVIIPSSIENYPVKEIGGGNCFSNINKVESITVPDSVVAIGDFRFFGCPNLTKVVIPSSVKKIGATVNPGSHFTIYGESGSYR